MTYHRKIFIQKYGFCELRFYHPFSMGSQRVGHNWATFIFTFAGFPDSSVGKESACNAGDPSSTPGLGRSAGEGIVYPLQYSWAPLVAQLVKNLPALWETWVQSLGWEDPLEKGTATHSSILACSPWGCKVRHDWVTLKMFWHAKHFIILSQPSSSISFPSIPHKAHGPLNWYSLSMFFTSYLLYKG